MGGVDRHFTATVIIVDPQLQSFALMVTYLAVTLISRGDVSSLTATVFAKKTNNKNKNNRQSSLPFIFANYKKLKILSLWNELSFKTIFTLGSRYQSLITRGSLSTGYPYDFE